MRGEIEKKICNFSILEMKFISKNLLFELKKKLSIIKTYYAQNIFRETKNKRKRKKNMKYEKY